jgi:hypothetical protein
MVRQRATTAGFQPGGRTARFIGYETTAYKREQRMIAASRRTVDRSSRQVYAAVELGVLNCAVLTPDWKPTRVKALTNLIDDYIRNYLGFYRKRVRWGYVPDSVR